ncbi:MAG TPA: glycosyltransferase family 4 protein [Polyangia bacterium]|nr:glycosyltransferase family 4 protein [Polyangia bacterium]
MVPARVLMTIDAVGGVWTYGLDLAGGLRARGADVLLAVMGPAPSPAQAADARSLGLRIEHAPLRLEWMADPWRDLEAAGEWLVDLERRHRADVVHLNGYALARRSFASPTIVVAHSCVLSWWEAVRGGSAPAEWARYRDAVEEGLAAASWVVSPTRWMHGALARHYGVPARASVIHNARPDGPFRPASKRPFVLAAGRVWDEAKNFAALARAARSVSWPIKIAGPLAPPGDGSGAVTRQSFGGRVELLGPVCARDMVELYGRAEIYALPARYEPFGLTALEAALSGCALVLGDIPSLRELWQGAAVFVDPGDGRALARALEDLVRSPSLRRESASRARARALAFRHEDMVDAYLRVYAAAASGAEDVDRKEPMCAS